MATYRQIEKDDFSIVKLEVYRGYPLAMSKLNLKVDNRIVKVIFNETEIGKAALYRNGNSVYCDMRVNLPMIHCIPYISVQAIYGELNELITFTIDAVYLGTSNVDFKIKSVESQCNSELKSFLYVDEKVTLLMDEGLKLNPHIK